MPRSDALLAARSVSLAAYQAALSESVYPIKIDLADPEASFRGGIAARSVGKVALIQANANASFRCVRRPAPHRASNDAFLLQLQRAGATLNEQRGAAAYCPPGTMVLLDARSTLTAEQIGAAEALVVRIPAALLLAHLPRAELCCAVPVDSKHGAPHILAAMIQQLWDVEAALTSRDREALPHALLRLVETVFDSAAGTKVDCDDWKFAQLKRTIADDCYDPNLSADELASKLGISRRSLFSLTSRHGTSAERLIIAARLEVIERRLRDTNAASQSLTDLAFQAGFRDFSHFCRKFKAAFGSTPGEYRRSSLSGVPSCTVSHKEMHARQGD